MEKRSFIYIETFSSEKIKVIIDKNTTSYRVNEFLTQQTALIIETLILILEMGVTNCSIPVALKLFTLYSCQGVMNTLKIFWADSLLLRK